MFKRLVCWILSKLFPFNKHKRGKIGENSDYHGKSMDWDMAKTKENESYYGGRDGTTWRFEK